LFQIIGVDKQYQMKLLFFVCILICYPGNLLNYAIALMQVYWVSYYSD